MKTRLGAYVMLGLFCFNTVYSQNQSESDSLIEVYNKQDLTDTEKLVVFEGIAAQGTNPEENLYYSNLLIDLAKKKNETLWLHRGYLQKGKALRIQGEFEDAIDVYFKSAEAADRINYKEGVGGAYLSIADVYGDNGNRSTSLKYRDLAIGILRQGNDSTALATALLNTGYELYLMGDYDGALVYYSESQSIFEKNDFQVGRAYNLGNAGLVYAKTGQTTKAEKQLKQAIEILSELEDSYAITEFQNEMASIYVEKGDLITAEKLLLESLNFAIEDGLQERIRDASLQLSTLYSRTRQYQKAHKYQSQYIAYRDSINNEEVIRKMADLRTEFEVGQKQAEVDLLNSKTRTQQIVLMAVLIVLLLVVVLVYVLYKLFKLRDRAMKISKERRKVIVSQRNRLENLNNTKDKFFSIISHDIRGPISNLHGVAQLIKIYVESGETQELIRVGKMLERSSAELSALLDNLLDWAMSQQGRFPYKPEELDLIRICNDNLVMMENMAASKGISLTTEGTEDIKLYADKNSVSTITRNLLSNALKFTGKDGEVNLKVNRFDDMGVLTITDTGIGIPEEKMKTLFGFQGERSRWGTSGEKGVGLGLNLVKEFVDMNHGRIEVESEEGVGTMFMVFLPLAN